MDDVTTAAWVLFTVAPTDRALAGWNPVGGLRLATEAECERYLVSQMSPAGTMLCGDTRYIQGL